MDSWTTWSWRAIPVLVSVADYQLLFGFEFNSQTGNVLSINVSNPAAPTLATVLFGSSDPNANTTQLGVTLVNSQIAYVASSTNTGSSTQDGEGRVLVVNYSNPADLTYTQLLIPGTYQVVDIGIQGSEALVVGRTGGTDAYGVNGTMTLSLLDITNPLSPVLLGTMLVTQGQFPSGTGSSLNKISALPLGNGIFAVSESTVSGNPELMLVDPSNPNNILVTYTPVPALVNEMAVSGDLLYASSTQGLTIYNIGTFQGIPLSVSVEVPTSDVSIVAGSYSTPPTSVTTGTSYDTLTWNETYTFGDPTFPITWQSTVSNLAAGQVVPVTLGATGSFTYEGTPGTFQTPGTSIAGVSIIGLLPSSQTVPPGGTATYDVQLTNPTSSLVTYSFGVSGVSGTISSISVGPDSTADDTLQVSSDSNQAAGAKPFTVSVQSGSGAAKGSVPGTLVLAGTPIIQPSANAYGVVAALTSTSATAGPQTSASYVVQVTNTGSTEETYRAAVSGLPGSGTSYSFSPNNQVTVPPGASNFVDLPLSVSVGSVTPGVYPFTVTLSSTDNTSSTTVNGTVDVVASGVSVYLNTSTIAAGGTLTAQIVNRSSATDTFNLTLGGPDALAASLAQTFRDSRPGSQHARPDHDHRAGDLRNRRQPVLDRDGHFADQYRRDVQRHREHYRQSEPRA